MARPFHLKLCATKFLLAQLLITLLCLTDLSRRKRQEVWISFIFDVLIEPTIGQIISFLLLGFDFFFRKAIESRRPMPSYRVRHFVKDREDEIACCWMILCCAGCGKDMVRKKNYLTFAILRREATRITFS